MKTIGKRIMAIILSVAMVVPNVSMAVYAVKEPNSVAQEVLESLTTEATPSAEIEAPFEEKETPEIVPTPETESTPEIEPTPEAEPTPAVEPIPDVTPTPDVQVTEEATPTPINPLEPEATVTPELTQTPEVTATPEMTTTQTPSVTPTPTNMLSNNNQDTSMIASGVWCGIEWSIDANGHLEIGGVADATYVGTTAVYNIPWYKYRYDVKTARVTVKNVTDTEFWFSNLNNLESIDVSNFDTSDVTNMTLMFQDCDSLQSLDLSNFDTSKVTDMSKMFDYCSSLQSLDLSNFDTSKVNNMASMFARCSSLKSIDLSNFNTSQVGNMSNMFWECSSLQNIDLSNFDTSQVRSMSNMFADCSSIQNLDLSNFNMGKASYNSGGMLKNGSFKTLKTPINVKTNNMLLPFIMYDSFGQQYESLPINLTESICLTKQLDISDLSESGTYEIKIVNSETKKPVKGVNIEIDQTCCSTDNWGKCRVSLTNPTVSKIKITGNTYQAREMTNSVLVSNKCNVFELTPVMTIPTISLPKISGTANTSGPDVTIGKKKAKVLNFDYELNFDFGGRGSVQIKEEIDKEKGQIKYSIGPKLALAACDYEDIKNKCKSLEKKKNTIKQIEEMLKDPYKKGGEIGGKVDFTTYGYLTTTFDHKILENGLIVIISGEDEFTHHFASTGGVLYGTFKMEVKASGDFKWVYTGGNLSTEALLKVETELTIGVGLGCDLVHIEGGVKGNLNSEFDFPWHGVNKSLRIKFEGEAYGEAKFLVFKSEVKHKLCDISLWGYEKKSRGLNQTQMNNESIPSDDMNIYIDTNNLSMMSRDYLQESQISSPDYLNNANQNDFMFNSSSNDSGALSETDSFTCENLFPEGYVQYGELANGTKLLTWVHDYGTKSDANRTTLVYSVNTGAGWSEPQAIKETGRGDYYPSMTVVGNNAYVVWMNASKEFDNTVTQEELCANIDICVSEFSNGQFSEPIVLSETDNGKLEFNPMIVAEGNRVSVAWVENTVNDPFMDEGTNTLFVCEYKNRKWNQATNISEGLTSISSYDIEYINGNVAAAYCVDADGDVSTEDNALYYFKDGKITRVGNVDENISSVNFLDDMLYFTENRALKRAKTEQLSHCYSTGIECDSFHVLKNAAGNEAITFLNTDGYASELNISYLRNDTWTKPVPLIDNGNKISSYSDVFNSDGTISFAMNQVKVLEDSGDEYSFGNTDMVVSTNLKADTFMVDSVLLYEEEEILPNNVVSFQTYAYNETAIPVTSLRLTLMDGNSNVLSTETVAADLAVGEKELIEISYTLPQTITKTECKLIVEPSDFEDSDMSDNEASCEFGYGDLVLEELKLTGNQLSGMIVNRGYDDISDIKMTIYADNNEGKKLTEINCESEILSVGGEWRFNYTVPDDALEFSDCYDTKYFFCETSGAEEEASYGNNSEITFGQPILSERISLDNTELTMTEKTKRQLRATLYPDNTFDKTVTFLSENNGIATVDQEGNITAVGVGETVINVISADGNSTASCNITVEQASNLLYSLSDSTLGLTVGNKGYLSVSATTSGELVSENVIWSSTDENIVTVENGVLTAVGGGVAAIQVKVEGSDWSDVCLVQVLDNSLQGLTLSAEYVELNIGDTYQLEESTIPENAIIVGAYTYTSDHEDVASVNESGLITVIGAGDAVITVRGDNGVEASCIVSVAAVEEIMHTVSFDSCGGTDVAAIDSIVSGSCIPSIPSSYREDYVFLGWYTQINGQGEKLTENTVIEGDAHYYAHWLSKINYTVELDCTSISLGLNETKQLSATVTPSDRTAEFISNNPEIAIVSSEGLVTAVAEGTTVIYARAGNTTVQCHVLVTDDTINQENKFSINVGNSSIIKGENTELGATYNGNKLDLSDIVLKYSSDEAGEIVLTTEIDNMGRTLIKGTDDNTIITYYQGTIYATGLSTMKQIYIHASYIVEGENEMTAVIPLSIHIPTQTIKISGDKSRELFVGETINLVENITSLPVNAEIEVEDLAFSSTNERVATINDEGIINGVSQGRAEISVSTADGQTDSIVINVKPLVVPDFSLNVQSLTLYVNGEDSITTAGVCNPKTFVLDLVSEEGNTDDISVSWSSSDETVATVDAEGKIIAVGVNDKTKTGTAIITAEDANGSGKYATCTVTVRRQAESLETLADNILEGKEKLVLIPGKSFSLSSKVMPENATDKNIVYLSEDNAIATVNTKGTIAAKKVGETQITIWQAESGILISVPIKIVEKTNVTTKVTINGEDTGAVNPGINIQLNAICEDSEGTTLSDRGVIWKSSNNKVVTIAQDGTITTIAKGTADITATAADGSGKKAVRRVKVIAPVTKVSLNKEYLFLQAGKSETLKATIAPANADNKNVVWNIEGEGADSGNIYINTKGKVTVSKNTPIGTTATLTVSSTTDASIQDTCVVKVISKPITSLKLDQTALELTGLGGTKQLTVTTGPIDAEATEEGISWISSDEAVISISSADTPITNGIAVNEITTVGYGKATITAMTADGTKKVSCKISVYPLEKGYKLSAVKGTQYIQIYGEDTKSGCDVEIKDQFGTIIAPERFTYTSSNLNIAKVNSLGHVQPNPAWIKDGTVTITATLAGDPSKRNVKFTVKLLQKPQVETVEIEQKRGENSYSETKGEIRAYSKGETMTFRAVTYNSNGENIKSKVKWTLSDSSYGKLKINKDETVTLTISKAGRFSLMCTVQDTWKKCCSIPISMLSYEPSVSTTGLTINRKTTEGNSTAFKISEINGSEVLLSESTISSVKKGKQALSAAEVAAFTLRQNADGTYCIHVENAILSSLTKGTYNVTMEITTGAVEALVEAGAGTPLETGETIHRTSKVFKLTITDNEPKISLKNVTIDCYDTATEARKANLVITAPGKVKKIEPVSNQANGFEQLVSFEETSLGSGVWRVCFTGDESYNKKNIKGKVSIIVEGYNAVVKDLTINTPSTAPKYAAEKAALLDGTNKQTANIRLMNNTAKKVVKDYIIESQSETRLVISKGVNGMLHIRLADGVQVKNGTKLTSKLQITNSADTFSKPVTVNVTATIYSSSPAITLGKDKFTLNLGTNEESVQTTIKTNRDNVDLLESNQWDIQIYDKATKNYIACDDVKFSYANGTGIVGVAFSDNNTLVAGTYKLRVKGVLENYENVYKDITLTVINKVATVSLKTSGSIDLINRSNTSLTVKATFKNVEGRIGAVTLGNSDYYPILTGDNVFTVKLKQTAVTKTKKITIPVTITLEGGTILNTTFSCTPMQSVPKVIVPSTAQIRKSSLDRSVSYNLQTGMKANIKINTISTVSVPSGLKATTRGGVVFVYLTNRNLKPGTYNIKVNSYFKGAQSLFGYPNGKPVTSTIKVKVVE